MKWEVFPDQGWGQRNLKILLGGMLQRIHHNTEAPLKELVLHIFSILLIQKSMLN